MIRHDDPNAAVTILIGTAGALILLVTVLLLHAYFYSAAEAELNRKVSSVASPELARMRAEHLEALSSYRWVDQTGGVVAIPIERAMALIAAESRAANRDAR
jgi:hypothetical protein